MNKPRSSLLLVMRRFVPRAWPLLLPYRQALLALVALSLVITGLQLAPPLITRYIVDRIILADNLGEDAKRLILVRTGLWASIFFIGLCALKTVRSWCAERINARLVTETKRVLFRKLIELPLPVLHRFKTGEIVTRLGSDVDTLSSFVDHGVITPAVAALRLAAAAAIVAGLNWKFALGIGAVGALVMLLRRHLNLVARQIFREVHAAIGRLGSDIGETFNGVRVVKAFNQQAKEEARFANACQSLAQLRAKAGTRNGAAMHLGALVTDSVLLCILCYGGHMAITGELSIGDLLAVAMYSAFVLQPIMEIMRASDQSQNCLAAVERIIEIMRLSPERGGRSEEMPARPLEVEFKNVSFSYEDRSPVLNGVSLRFVAPRVVAILGRSGTGKSTFIDLLLRFVRPSTGAIMINGVDIERMKLASYRSLIGLVPQDTFIFDGSITDNIRYGRPDASEVDVRRAAELAQLDEFIATLPLGYETRLGERGYKVSGGQRQRLSIARAFLLDPAILIFDEATSNLDAETERQLLRSLRLLKSTQLTFIVTHRRATALAADDVIVLHESGRVELADPATYLIESAAARGGESANEFKSTAKG